MAQAIVAGTMLLLVRQAGHARLDALPKSRPRWAILRGGFGRGPEAWAECHKPCPELRLQQAACIGK